MSASSFIIKLNLLYIFYFIIYTSTFIQFKQKQLKKNIVLKSFKVKIKIKKLILNL